MPNEITLNYLETYTTVELKQKRNGQVILDLPFASYKIDKQGNLIFLEGNYFTYSNIYLSKHNRFADFPKHRHHFVEINYMLRGSCEQVVDGKNIYLQERDILFMNAGCSHSINKLSENDLMINIAFTFKNLNLYWLAELNHSQSYILNFLFHNTEDATNQYIIFKGESNPDLLSILDSIMNKYFTSIYFPKSLVNSYFDILLMELLSNIEADIRGAETYIESTLFNIFLDIHNNFRTISLTSLSEKYGYHKNYLSKLIKKSSKQSFSEIIVEQRMNRAAFLLKYTQLSIQDIMEDINLQNRGHFYNLFKKRYDRTPADYRKTNE